MTIRSLQRKLTRKLTSYAAAAAAAFATRESGARIIYTDLGETGIEINNLFAVDLDDDGESDVALVKDGDRHIHCGGTVAPYCSIQSYSILRASGTGGARVHLEGNGQAKAFAPGDLIQAEGLNADEATIAFASFSYDGLHFTHYTRLGDFFYHEPTYLGVIFELANGRRAGWIEVLIRIDPPFAKGQFDARVFGFAYETEADAPIAAGAVPEPPSLVLLAAGAVGLAILRRQRRTAS